jgi:hypothetical protein
MEKFVITGGVMKIAEQDVFSKCRFQALQLGDFEYI